MIVQIKWLIDDVETWVPGFLYVKHGEILWTPATNAKVLFGEDVWDCLWDNLTASNTKIM